MLTPLDIENKRFSKQMMNGYSVEEIDEFLDQLTLDYQTLYRENASLKEKISDMEASINHYKTIYYKSYQHIDTSINNNKKKYKKIIFVCFL